MRDLRYLNTPASEHLLLPQLGFDWEKKETYQYAPKCFFLICLMQGQGWGRRNNTTSKHYQRRSPSPSESPCRRFFFSSHPEQS